MTRNYRVYVLTPREAWRLEHRQEEPNLANHRDVALDEAREMVGRNQGDGEALWVGNNYRFIVELPKRSWVNKMSGDFLVKQMVRGGRGPKNRRGLEALRNQS